MLNYKEEVIKAMKLLGEDKRTIFIGQTVAYEGSVISDTLKDVPMNKRIEMPVAEEMQCGIGLGMAISGNYLPVLIYPRFDFLLCAVNQLVNHLDVMDNLSYGQYKPQVIIRTIVGSKYPLDGGIQHTRDYTEVFQELLTNVKVIKLDKASLVVPIYKKLLEYNKSALIIEMAELY